MTSDVKRECDLFSFDDPDITSVVDWTFFYVILSNPSSPHPFFLVDGWWGGGSLLTPLP